MADIAQANGVDRKMLVWAKAVWNAADASEWRLPGAFILPRDGRPPGEV